MSAALPTSHFLDNARRPAFIVGALALALVVGLGVVWPAQFFRSYLIAFFAWLAVPLGCLALTMIHHLTGGAWGLALRRVARAAYRTLPLLGLFFLPLLLGMPELYPWARPEVVAHDVLLREKSAYLNVPFFAVRAGVYFVIWIVLAYILSRPADDEGTRRSRALSGPGLALFGLTVTFAAIDWAMSLEPLWFSSIYGAMIANGTMLAGLAFAVMLTLAFGQPTIPTDVLRDLGNLMLAFTMLWAYLAFSQLLLIWSANLPEEIPWYLRRLDHGWQWVALALLLLQFVVPFGLLLSRAIKRDPRKLALVAGLIFTMRFVDTWWTLAPAFAGESMAWSALDLAAIVGVGGLWLGVFLSTLPPEVPA